MKRKIYVVIMCILISICLLNGLYLGVMVYKTYDNESYFKDLAKPKETKTISKPHKEIKEVENLVMPKYSHVFEKNKDMVGWIAIENTKLSYPVMHTPNSPDYYLRRSFEKTYSDFGVPYLSEECDIDSSDNLVIHGHNIIGGMVFGSLKDFKDKEFFDENNVITLETLKEKKLYTIFAVSLVTAFDFQTDIFPYYSFINAKDDKEYFDYINELEKYSIIFTDTDFSDTPQLITLSTCESSILNGRLIVSAYLESTTFF